ncbi:PTS sugar transporter subunit IIA [Ligilactobacillus salivarius]|uniref:PTS sugar transporter subunit IIA n=1 Tax=Ligilactobacillus salivarius TaxID=1624 RepID=A0A921IF22_9LACO|nr:PTS sugar transporter subunit IIA [Ligilactobacillus salivarius]HJG16545.1 PTS sugar transporter subunit IIA [Ligilactobacillus salivarius]
MNIKDFLHDELIFTKTSFKNTTELFKEVAKIAEEKGYANSLFLEKIIKREETFPTGLQLENNGVAIPHTDADTIEKEFVAVITLEDKGVPFKRMDNPNEEVEAKVVFVLGLNQPHQQLEMLQSLMAFIQDNEKLKQLETAQTVDDVKEVF